MEFDDDFTPQKHFCYVLAILSRAEMQCSGKYMQKFPKLNSAKDMYRSYINFDMTREIQDLTLPINFSILKSGLGTNCD